MRRYISYRRQDEEVHLLQEAGLWRYICRVCYTIALPPLLPSSHQVNSFFCLRPKALKPECWSTMSSRVHPKHVGTQCVYTPH